MALRRLLRLYRVLRLHRERQHRSSFPDGLATVGLPPQPSHAEYLFDMLQFVRGEVPTVRGAQRVAVDCPAFPILAGQGIAAQDAQHAVSHPRDARTARFPVLDGASGNIEGFGSLQARQSGLSAQIAEILRLNPDARTFAAAHSSLPCWHMACSFCQAESDALKLPTSTSPLPTSLRMRVRSRSSAAYSCEISRPSKRR